MRSRSPILAAVALAALAFAPAALAVPLASFSQTQLNATPFTYTNATGAFSATTTVDFNFLVPNTDGVGSQAATLTLTGTTTGPVTNAAGLLIESLNITNFAIRRVSDNANLLSGTFNGTISGAGAAGSIVGSESAGHSVVFTSDFLVNVGGGLQSVATLFSRDASFSLAGITPGPLTQSGGNLSGSPAPSNFSAAISGVFSAVPEPSTVLLMGLGLVAVPVLRLRRRVK